MTRLFDRVIVSADDNPDFYEFWPLVAQAWSKLFPGITVELAFVTIKTREDPLIIEYSKFGIVSLVTAISNCPYMSQGKLARLYMATTRGPEVVQVNDVDLLPLQTAYYLDRLDKRKPGELLAIGSEHYEGSKDSGKFPMSYATAEGNVWKAILNPQELGWTEWVKSFKGMYIVDKKEDPFKPRFSDESLLRALLTSHVRAGIDIPVCDIGTYIQDIYVNTVSRPNWNLDPVKLKNGEYIQSHMARPLKSYREDIRPLAEYLNIKEATY